MNERTPTQERQSSADRWVYESILGAIPGVEFSRGQAMAIQLAVFEVCVLGVGLVYGRPESIPAGTAAVVVASAGSALLLTLARRLRTLNLPDTYLQVLFGSQIEIVLGLMSFVGLLTYLFVLDPQGPGQSLLVALLGDPLPPVGVFIALLILWDVCYRIGTGWWASLVGLWRSIRFGASFDRRTRRELGRTDALNIGFSWMQLLLVPFVRGHIILMIAIIGHVLAVTLVSGTSILLLRPTR